MVTTGQERKPVQVVCGEGGSLIVLANDGTMWISHPRTRIDWVQLPGLPRDHGVERPPPLAEMMVSVPTDCWEGGSMSVWDVGPHAMKQPMEWANSRRIPVRIGLPDLSPDHSLVIYPGATIDDIRRCIHFFVTKHGVLKSAEGMGPPGGLRRFDLTSKP